MKDVTRTHDFFSLTSSHHSPGDGVNKAHRDRAHRTVSQVESWKICERM